VKEAFILPSDFPRTLAVIEQINAILDEYQDSLTSVPAPASLPVRGAGADEQYPQDLYLPRRHLRGCSRRGAD
jgi:hypothetical protein